MEKNYPSYDSATMSDLRKIVLPEFWEETTAETVYKLFENSSLLKYRCPQTNRSALNNAILFDAKASVVKALLELGHALEVHSDRTRDTPLAQAAFRSSYEIVELLLDYGANVHSINRDMQTPLLHAVIGNSFKVIKLLVERGSEVNIHDKWSGNPLQFCIDRPNGIKIAKFLLSHGADVNFRGRKGKTALIESVQKFPDYSTTELLLEAGAETDTEDDEGKTAYEYAIENGCRNERLMEALKPRRFKTDLP